MILVIIRLYYYTTYVWYYVMYIRSTEYGVEEAEFGADRHLLDRESIYGLAQVLSYFPFTQSN